MMKRVHNQKDHVINMYNVFITVHFSYDKLIL